MASYTHLIPAITSVLTAPGVDLASISAKSVRKSILAADAELDPDWVRSNKNGIDELIATIFNTVNASRQADENASAGDASPPDPSSSAVLTTATTKRKREDEWLEGGAGRPTATAAPVRPSISASKRSDTPQTKQEVDDAEYARQLSAQLNASARGRTTRGGGTSSRSNGASSSSAAGGKKRKAGASRSSKVKSPSKIIDSDLSGSEAYGEEDDDASDGGAVKKKPTKRKRAAGGEGGAAKGGFGKEFLLSEPLSAVCGGQTRLSRPQVVKSLWDYIKSNELQNPRNRRQILCDEKLSSVFKSARIDMFTMNKELGAHLYDASDAP